MNGFWKWGEKKRTQTVGTPKTGALSALQILENENPKVRALTEEIAFKERALNKAKDEYAYYLNEHESDISVTDAKRHIASIECDEEELEKLKIAKYELLKRLQGDKKGEE